MQMRWVSGACTAPEGCKKHPHRGKAHTSSQLKDLRGVEGQGPCRYVDTPVLLFKTARSTHIQRTRQLGPFSSARGSSLECGVWSVERGVRSAECGVRSAEFAVHYSAMVR